MKKQRILGLFLSFVFLLAAFSLPAHASDYESHWSAYYIDRAHARGWMKPDDAGNFSPGRVATRAEFALMLWQALDRPEPETACPFVDVSGTDPAYKAVAALCEADIVRGTGKEKFSPEMLLTRETAFTMLGRAFGFVPQNGDAYKQYADAAGISDWSREHVSALTERGFVSGVGGNRCAPREKLTRGQMAKLLVEIYDELGGAREPRVIKINSDLGRYMALDDRGKVYAWGGAPEVPEDLPRIVDVGVGTYHAVALDEDGKLHGWGTAKYGELDFSGDLPPFTAIAVSGHNTTALTADGKVYQWGTANGGGPGKVPKNLPPITKIYANGYFTLAVDKAGSTYVWGAYNQPVTAPVKAAAFALLWDHTAVLGADGKIYNDVAHVNKQYFFKPQPALSNIYALFGGGSNLAAIDREGKVYVWGEYEKVEGQMPSVQVPANLPPVCQVALGTGNIACLGIDGKVYAWGASYGEAVPDAINGFLNVGPVFEPFSYPEFKEEVSVSTEVELFDAIRNGSKAITVQKSFDVTNDLRLKRDQTLIVARGVTLAIRARNVGIEGKLLNRGTIRVYGRLMMYNDNSEFGDMDVKEGDGVSRMVSGDVTVADITRYLGADSIYTEVSVVGSKPDGILLIDRDLTIPKGKTLWLNDENTLRVAGGVTLRVAGRLETYHAPVIEGTVIGEITIVT